MSRNRKIESVHSTLRALGIFHGDQTRRPLKIQYRNRNGVVHEPDEHIRLFERTYDPVMWALGIAMPAAKQRPGLYHREAEARRRQDAELPDPSWPHALRDPPRAEQDGLRCEVVAARRVPALVMGRLDLTGQKFGRLHVVQALKERRHRAVVWRCHCHCGKQIDAVGYQLKNGHIQSCGCSRTKHGLIKHPLYLCWASMRSRLRNPIDTSYRNYGARGIAVCKAWNEDFLVFYCWAKKGYRKGLSIDRKNNDGDYTPDNCRWATAKEQVNNRRSVDQWHRSTSASFSKS
jgi:hypothetical protein